MSDIDNQLKLLKRGCDELIVETELREKLKSGRRLRIKIGDFTGMIGDPSGKNETRPSLSREQILQNAKTYQDQIFKVLDANRTEILFNSKWSDELGAAGLIRLAATWTVARMLEREDFRSRLANQQPISVHELLYPLLTAYDAVSLKSDVELGATEQKFNLLVHRDIQREYGLEGEICVTMPILVGLDGSKKMSKSLGNYVGITEAPAEIFGKMMSIPDDLMWSYYELVTDRTPEEVAALKADVSSGKLHPMDAKMRLGQEVVSDFHGADAGKKAAENFQRVFRDREAPVEVPVQKIPRGPAKKLIALLVELQLAPSKSEAERLIKQKGVEINETPVEDFRKELDLSKPAEFLIRAGKKKFLRLVVE